MKNRFVALLIEGTFPWYRGGVSEWVNQYLNSSPGTKFGILQIVLPPYMGRDPRRGLYQLPENVVQFCQVQPPDLQLAVQDSGLQLVQYWLEESLIKAASLLENADILHAANTGFAGLLGVHIKKKMNVPLVTTEHAVYWKEISSGAVALECGYPIERNRAATTQKYQHFFQGIARYVYSASDEVISVARTNIDEQKRLGAREPHYIPNGVAKESLVEKHNLVGKSEEMVIGWVGRCAHIKQPLRFLELVESLNSLSSDPENAQQKLCFVMYLSRSGEEELELNVEKASKNFDNLELVWDQPAQAAMRIFDALCISSISEAQPLVALEAIASGALPFGWSSGDLDDEFGLFASQESSVSKVAQLILQARQDACWWQQKMVQLFKYVGQHHTWEHIFDRYHDLFDGLVEAKNTSKGQEV